MKRVILTAALLVFSQAAAAETYRWVDDSGAMNFTEDLGKVPKKYRKKALVVGEEEAALPAVGGPEVKPGQAELQGKDDQQSPAVANTASVAKDLSKQVYGWKDGAGWKASFAEVNADLKGYEKQLVEQRNRLKDTTGLSRNDFLTIQNTIKSLEYSVLSNRKKLEELKQEAQRVGVPPELME